MDVTTVPHGSTPHPKVGDAPSRSLRWDAGLCSRPCQIQASGSMCGNKHLYDVTTLMRSSPVPEVPLSCAPLVGAAARARPSAHAAADATPPLVADGDLPCSPVQIVQIICVALWSLPSVGHWNERIIASIASRTERCPSLPPLPPDTLVRLPASSVLIAGPPPHPRKLIIDGGRGSQRARCFI